MLLLALLPPRHQLNVANPVAHRRPPAHRGRPGQGVLQLGLQRGPDTFSDCSIVTPRSMTCRGRGYRDLRQEPFQRPQRKLANSWLKRSEDNSARLDRPVSPIVAPSSCKLGVESLERFFAASFPCRSAHFSSFSAAPAQLIAR